MMQHAFYCYHRCDDNMLETCLNSLHHVNSQAQITVVTDGVPKDVEEYCREHYGVNWIMVSARQMHKRRATCKIESLEGMVRDLKDEDQILVSDVDVYYLKDPFQAFELNPPFDIGLTTRGYKHLFPINGGIFYLLVSEMLKEWLQWHVQEILHPTWTPYVQLRSRYHHEHFGLDWSVGQDFLIATWLNREEAYKRFGLMVEDVGPYFNYCPPTDTMPSVAYVMVQQALAKKEVGTIHLKSDLKKMIYWEKTFPNVCLRHPKGKTAWL